MRLFGAAVLAVAAIALAGCTSTVASEATPEATGPAGNAGANWIFTKQALAAVTANPEAKARLSGSRIFEIVTQNEQPSTVVPVVPTVSFKSFTALQSAIDSGGLRSDVRAVIYDSEHWAQTPAAEQRDPASYYQQAAAVAHAHHLIFIATPAMDLVNATGKATDATKTFLTRDIDGAAAKYADVIDIQAQSLERNTTTYQQFVQQAAAQIRSANPHVAVIAGLSTNPHGSAITPDMLVSDMTAVSGVASGFWMNIPDQGTSCPNCATPRPDVAINTLTDARMAKLTTLFTH